MFVTGLVLAAGRSQRLGRPKQLLPYRGATLLDATLRVARACGFDQLLVTVGGAADEVRTAADLTGCEVVDNEQFATGCSSSIAAATARVDPRADGVVLLLGDQPGVRADSVRRLVTATTATTATTGGSAALGVCRYADGRGHPFWLGRDVFGQLLGLHGDKAVWKLLDAAGPAAVEVAVDGDVPLDVDTWDDYQALLARDGAEVGP